MNKEISALEFNSKDNTLAVFNKLTKDNVMALRQAGENYIQQCSSLTIDLNAVKYCDSAALSLLMCWLRYAKRQGSNIKLINLPQQLLDIIKLSGLEKILETK